jgi:hypothetical protein
LIDNTEFLRLYRSLDLNVLPANSEVKFSTFNWKPYQTKKYDGVIKQTDELCILPGESSNNLVVLDLDAKELAREIFSDWEGLLKSTIVVETGRGFHIWLRPTGLLPPTLHSKDKHGRKIDLISQGGLVIVPPSYHKSGVQYKIISESRQIMKTDINTLLLHLAKKGFDINKKRFNLEEIKDGVSEGERDNTCFDFAMFMRREYRLDKNAVLLWLREWNKKNRPPMSDSQVEKVVNSVFSYTDVYNQKQRSKDQDLSACGTLAFHKLVTQDALSKGIGIDQVLIECIDCNKFFKFKFKHLHERHKVRLVEN